MPLCRNCHHHYRGEEPYCEGCDEFKRQMLLEEWGIQCQHCGATFMPGGFDKHRWRVYYKEHFFVQGKRQRR